MCASVSVFASSEKDDFVHRSHRHPAAQSVPMSVIMMNGFEGGQHGAAANSTSANSNNNNNNTVLHIKREPVEQQQLNNGSNSFVDERVGQVVNGGGGGAAGRGTGRDGPNSSSNNSANHTPSQMGANSVSSVSSSASERMRSSSSEPQMPHGGISSTTPVWSPSVHHPAYADFDLYASQLNGNLGSAAAAAASASCCLGPPPPSSNGNGPTAGGSGSVLSGHNLSQHSQHSHHGHPHHPHLAHGGNSYSYASYASSAVVAASSSQSLHDGLPSSSSSSSVASVVSGRHGKPSAAVAAKFWSNSYDSVNGTSPPMPSDHSSIMAAAVCHPSAFAERLAHQAAAAAWCGYPSAYPNAASSRVTSVDPYLGDPDPRSAFVDSAAASYHQAMRMSAISEQSCGGNGGGAGGSVTPVTSWPQPVNGIPSSSTSNSTSK